MLFNSYLFVGVFLPIVVLGYWLLLRVSNRAALFWLAAASYVFYVYGEPIYPWLILISIIFNYGFGFFIHRAGSYRYGLLALGVFGNLGLLGYMKYYNFARAALHASWGFPLPAKEVILPIGISFFTFTQIAYLVDVYRDEAVDFDPLSYFLFVTFFPHLIAGPILHHKEMMPQFKREKRLSISSSLGSGLMMFAIGMFKKTVIADPLSQTASAIFNSSGPTSHITFLTAWITALCYTCQIYFDFSGYSDMAIGIARMFAIDLPVNFNSPYKADSIIDFWRRWHITLSRFLRDYLYIPLGGSRKGEARRFFNLFLTMVLGGIWHGAGWTFLLWGFLHGSYLIVNHFSRRVWKSGIPIPMVLCRIITFIAVVFAWVPFRANSLASTLALWKGMLGLEQFTMLDLPVAGSLAHHFHLPLETTIFTTKDVVYMVFALLLAWFAPNSQQIMENFSIGLDSPGYGAIPANRSKLLTFRPTLAYAIVLGIILGLGLRSIGGYSEFIYFHF